MQDEKENKDYLFFDIECADGTHMCSFGYVLADADFNVVERRDILINPRCEFKLGNRRSPYITLAYPEKAFQKSPDFSRYYDEIKSLLCKENRVLFGHSVASDLEFLDIACDRINRKRLRLSVFDTQKIYSEYKQLSEYRALEKIMEELEIDVKNLCAHKSCDDAEMTMITLKQICKNRNIGITELLNESKRFIVDRKTMDVTYKKREVRKLVNGAKSKHPESKAWKKIFVSDILDGFSLHIAHELIKVIYNAEFAVVLDADKCDYYLAGRKGIEKEKVNPDAEHIDYAVLSKMTGVKISDDGEIEYSENDNAVNSLKHFFEKAKINDKNKKRK